MLLLLPYEIPRKTSRRRPVYGGGGSGGGAIDHIGPAGSFWSDGLSLVNTSPPKLPAPPVITTTELPDGTEGEAYGPEYISYTGTPGGRWSLKAGAGYLPTGVGLNDLNGFLEGTPTAPADYDFTIIYTDPDGQADEQAFSVTIASAFTGINEDFTSGLGTLTENDPSGKATVTGGKWVVDGTSGAGTAALQQAAIFPTTPGSWKIEFDEVDEGFPECQIALWATDAMLGTNDPYRVDTGVAWVVRATSGNVELFEESGGTSTTLHTWASSAFGSDNVKIILTIAANGSRSVQLLLNDVDKGTKTVAVGDLPALGTNLLVGMYAKNGNTVSIDNLTFTEYTP